MTKPGTKQYKPYYITRSDGKLSTFRTIIVYPFSEKKQGYTAYEREQTDDSSRMNIIFEHGQFTPMNDIQDWVLSHYHSGGTYVVNGVERYLPATAPLIFKITQDLPKEIDNNETKEVIKEVNKEVFPRVLVESASPQVIIALLATKGHTIDDNADIPTIIKYMEENNLISD